MYKLKIWFILLNIRVSSLSSRHERSVLELMNSSLKVRFRERQGVNSTTRKEWHLEPIRDFGIYSLYISFDYPFHKIASIVGSPRPWKTRWNFVGLQIMRHEVLVNEFLIKNRHLDSCREEKLFFSIYQAIKD